MLFRRKGGRILFIVLAIVGVILTFNISNALALDQAACEGNDFGPDNECLGRLELLELGDFDENGVWQWDIKDPDLVHDIAIDQIMGDVGKRNWEDGGGLTPFKSDEVIVDWATIRNHIGPEDEYSWVASGDTSVMFTGSVDNVMVPEVWKIRYVPTNSPWFLITHEFKPEAIAVCDQYGWESPECAWWHEEVVVPDYTPYWDTLVPRYDAGYRFYAATSTELTKANVESITWNETGRVVGLSGDAIEHGINMDYDMGQNILQETDRRVSRTLYSQAFGSR